MARVEGWGTSGGGQKPREGASDLGNKRKSRTEEGLKLYSAGVAQPDAGLPRGRRRKQADMARVGWQGGAKPP